MKKEERIKGKKCKSSSPFDDNQLRQVRVLASPELYVEVWVARANGVSLSPLKKRSVEMVWSWAGNTIWLRKFGS